MSDTLLLGHTIGENFDTTVACFPDRDALVDIPAGRRWTYAELKADIDALTLGRLAARIATGHRVGIWAPTAPSGPSPSTSRLKNGAIFVNINPAYRTSESSPA